MSCNDCEKFQESTITSYIRIGTANVEIRACHKHLKEAFNRINSQPDLLTACKDSLTMLKEVLSQHMEYNADGSRVKIPLERNLEKAIAQAIP